MIVLKQIVGVFFFFFCVHFHCISQALYNYGGSIVIQSGATVAILGDFTNATSGSDGSIDLDGTITITGDWNNNATGGDVLTGVNTDGTVEFKGSSQQDLGGTRNTTFEKLTINNSSAAGVVMDETITVNSTLTLTDGVVTTGASDSIICSSTAGADITGHSNASFVNGILNKSITTNTDVYPLPVGNGTASTDYYLAEFVNNNVAGITALTVTVDDITESAPNDDATFAAAGIEQDGTPLVSIVEDAQWEIVGTGASISSGSYGMRLYVENLSGISGANDNYFTPVKRDNGATYADWDSFEGSTTIPAAGAAGRIYSAGAGYAERLGYTSLSFHAIAFGSFPLPVELLDFTASPKNGIVNLNWTTATEVGNDYFTVERSADGKNFEPIATVRGAGYSATHNFYHEVDKTPLNGTSYYRLKQTDFNGSYSYSDIVPVEIEHHISAELWMDDSNVFMHASGVKKATTLDVSLFGSNGQEMFTTSISLGKDVQKLNIFSCDRFAPGVYIAHLNLPNSKSTTQKLVVR